MINIEAIKRVLESQGKLDFKPFQSDNADQEFWAYRTSDNHFEVCDNNLISISRSRIGIEKPWYFVLNTEQYYRLLKEGESVSKIQEEQSNNPVRNVWLIKGTELIEISIDGYRSVHSRWIIFEPEKIVIKPNKDSTYWIPNKKIACYNSQNFLEESNMYYCGTYNDIDLYFSENGYYFTENRHTLLCIAKRHYFANLVVWFCKDGIKLVDIRPNNNTFLFELYEHIILFGLDVHNWDNSGDKCIGSHIINNNFSLSELNILASDNVFVLSNYSPLDSTWIAIDRFGNIGTEKKGKIVYFCNDIIKTDSSDEQEIKFEFYDYKGDCLSRITSKYVNYAIVTKSIETSAFIDESNKDSILTLKGVINTRNHSLVIPIRYENLEFFDAGDNFYAIIGEEFTDKFGIKTIQYGLLFNDHLLLPCNKVEIKSLSNNLFVWRNGKKYGLVSNGRICCDHIYDKISVALSEYDKYDCDEYACIYSKRKNGIFVPNWNMLIPPKYKEIIAFVEERFVLADGILYSTTCGDLTFIKDVTQYEHIGALHGYHLFRKKGSMKYWVNSYVCVFLQNGELSEEDVVNAKHDYNIDDYCKSDIDWCHHRLILSLGHSSVFYSVSDDCFEDDIYIFSSSSEPYIDPDEGYDYERDTYYALGGDDYETWKENGGDIDDMMDRMGF